MSEVPSKESGEPLLAKLVKIWHSHHNPYSKARETVDIYNASLHRLHHSLLVRRVPILDK